MFRAFLLRYYMVDVVTSEADYCCDLSPLKI